MEVTAPKVQIRFPETQIPPVTIEYDRSIHTVGDIIDVLPGLPKDQRWSLTLLDSGSYLAPETSMDSLNLSSGAALQAYARIKVNFLKASTGSTPFILEIDTNLHGIEPENDIIDVILASNSSKLNLKVSRSTCTVRDLAEVFKAQTPNTAMIVEIYQDLSQQPLEMNFTLEECEIKDKEELIVKKVLEGAS